MENKINNLPHEDGTTREEVLKKDKEELEKNHNKAVADAEKTVDEINSAKAKPFKEKLILPEDNILTESNEDEAEYEPEENLDEAVPKELVEPFKKARRTDRGQDDANLARFPSQGYNGRGYKSFGSKPRQQDGTRYGKIDFNNSEYTPITPEEAIAMKKNGEADKVLALLDGQIVAFNKDGKQLYRANRERSSDKDLYTRPNGDLMDHSGKLTYATVIGKASQLYKADEVVFPDELLVKRRGNPESGGSAPNIPTRNISGQTIGVTGRKANNNSYGFDSSDVKTYKISLQDYDKRIADYQNKMAGLDPESADYKYYQSKIDSAKESRKYYEKKYNAAKGYVADKNARVRYLTAEQELAGKFKQLKSLKDELYVLNREANDVSDELTRTRDNGSAVTRDNKRRLERLKSQLKDIRKQMVEVEIMLEGCDEDDAAELAKIQAKLDSIEASKSAKQAELDSLLGRNRKAEALEEADTENNIDIPAFNKIKAAGKVGELNDLLRSLYPEGITISQFKDILTYEEDYILKKLGVEEDNE